MFCVTLPMFAWVTETTSLAWEMHCWTTFNLELLKSWNIKSITQHKCAGFAYKSRYNIILYSKSQVIKKGNIESYFAKYENAFSVIHWRK